jgi:malate dehydrogenase (oxaloacetate-decarboxylating)
MTAAPSVSYSITVRLDLPSGGAAVSNLTAAVEQVGGLVTALDVTASEKNRIRIDVTWRGDGRAHAGDIVEALRRLPDVIVHKVSDRTF